MAKHCRRVLSHHGSDCPNTTADLRSLIKAAATGIPGARLWPNGLGFDHHGTQYTYAERLHVWRASRAIDRYATRSGEGATPDAAKRAAGIGRSEHRTRGGVA